MTTPTGPGFGAPVEIPSGFLGLAHGPYLISCTICGAALLVSGNPHETDEPTVTLHLNHHRSRGDLPSPTGRNPI